MFWIVDIDKDGRTGVRSSSVFHTLQGRLLFVALRHAVRKSNQASSYNYVSIADFNLDEKNAFFEIETDAGESMLQKFDAFDIDKQDPVFRPRKEFDGDLYSGFWSLYKSRDEDNRYIFDRHCSGLKLAPSSLFVHADEPILFRRSRDIANNEVSVSDLLSRWYRGQDRPPNAAKFSTTVRTAFSNLLKSRTEDQVAMYSYRPLLNLPAVISEDVLRVLVRAPGGGTRYRPEIVSAYRDTRTFGIAVAPSPKDLGEKLQRFVSFCWYLPDNDLSKRGNAHVFCNYFPNYKQGKGMWDDTPHLNVNRDFLTAIEEDAPDKVLFYVYAILCSDAYLDAFEPVLFTTSGSEQPRIPAPKSKEVFNEIASLGEELALLERHTKDEDIFLGDVYENHLASFTGEFKMTGYELDADSETLVLKGDQTRMEIKPVPKDVLEFHIGGYQVLQQWLKMHSSAYTRTNFTKQHFMRLLFVLQSIGKQIEIVNSLNEKVRRLISRGAV